MKAPVLIVEEVLHPLVEGIQPAQLEKAAKVLGPSLTEHGMSEEEVPETILDLLASADPTVEETRPGDAVTGKYTSWILSRWMQGVKQKKQSQWVLDNPEKAFEQDVFDERSLAELPEPRSPSSQELRRLSSDKSREIGVEAAKNRFIGVLGRDDPRAELRKALESHRRIVEFNRTEEYAADADINRYETIYDVIMSFQMDPETIHPHSATRRGDVDVLLVPGSKVFEETDKFVVYEITTPEAAMFHGSGTLWCFKDKSHAVGYTTEGPLYVVYVKGKASFLPTAPGAPPQTDVLYIQSGWTTHTEKYPTIKSNRKDYFKFLAISPYSMNVDTVNRHSSWDLWEIRDVENKWFSDIPVLRDLGLVPALYDIADEAENFSVPGALGFDTWITKGTYSDADIGAEEEDESEEEAARREAQRIEDQISDGGWRFIRLFAIDHEEDIDGITGEVLVSLDMDIPVTKANLAVMPRSRFQRIVRFSLYAVRTRSAWVNVFKEEDDDVWAEVIRVFRSEPANEEAEKELRQIVIAQQEEGDFPVTESRHVLRRIMTGASQ